MRRLARRFFFSLLSLLGLPRFLRFLRRFPSFAALVSRWPLSDAPDCLAAALRRLSTDPSARLALGVRRRGGRWEAHAWTESPRETPRDRDGFRRLGAL